MHEPVYGGHRHGLVREDYVPSDDQRIGRMGTTLGLLELGNQLKQRGGLDLGTSGLGMTDASHQMCPAKWKAICPHRRNRGTEVYRFQPRFFIYPPGAGVLKRRGG